MASEWQGGPLFYKQKKWNNGKTNDGAQRARLGLTKRGRFNPNPSTPDWRKAEDKRLAALRPRPLKFYRSKAKGIFRFH